jgi:cryptochrome
MQLGVILIFTLMLVSVVYHDSASKECKRKLAEAYALNKKLNGQLSQEDLDNLRRKLEQDEDLEPKIRRQRQKVGHLT